MRGILITGGSSELGIDLIERIQDKYDVIWGHYNKSAETLTELAGRIGPKLIPVQADFSDSKSVSNLINIIAQTENWPLDIVHLSAIGARNKPFSGWQAEDFEEEFLVEVSSIIKILDAFLPHMVEEHSGKVIFMLSSFVEGVSPKYQSPYIVSKYALYGLMKNLAAEYSDKGIRINAVSPDMIDTKFNDKVVRKIKELNAEKSPLKRNLKPSDVTPVIEFLLSERAESISGMNIPVTAGIELV